MNINEFATWLKNDYDFNCFSNDLFEKTLLAAQQEFENSTINGISFEEHYSNNVNQLFLEKHAWHLKSLLKQIPKPESQSYTTVHGINLSSYSSRIDELQHEVQKLKY